MTANLLIIGLSLLLLCVYRGFNGRNVYFSGRGFLLAVLLVILIAVKYMTTGWGNLLFAVSGVSLLINGALTLGGIGTLYLLKIKKPAYSPLYTGKLFALYLPMAFAEQILFLVIFAQSIHALTGSTIAASLAVSVFFRAFHDDSYLKRFSFLLYLLPFVWSLTYLTFGNIIWPSLSMALLGPLYYSFLSGKRVSL